MSIKKDNPDRLYTFSCATWESAHRGVSAELDVKIFSDKKKLRSHAIKHFANSYEVEQWKKFVKFNPNSISKRIDALKDAACLFFMLKTDSPPCLSCKVFSACTDIVQPLEEIYQQCIIEAIQAAIAIPRNVCFNWSDNGEVKEDYWAVPDIPVVIKMYRRDNCYMVATSFFPGAGYKITMSERLESLSRSIINKAHRNTISWCNEETWQTSVVPDRRKGKKSSKKGRQQASKKQSGKNSPRRKERGGSKNLTASYAWDDE